MSSTASHVSPVQLMELSIAKDDDADTNALKESTTDDTDPVVVLNEFDFPEAPTTPPGANNKEFTEEEEKMVEEEKGEEEVPIVEEQRPPIPVTILSGFLGSGKTTLLKRILECPDHKLKVAVIVNDMAELNIDAALVKQTSSIVQTEREIVSLQNGCICCTLRGDLIREIVRIREATKKKDDNDDEQEPAFDYVLIESTGIAEPQAVAQSFVFDPATQQLAESENQMLWRQARLDTCVTVIDAHMFLSHMSTLEQFGDRFDDGLDKSTADGIKEGEKSIANLLIDQVEFANLIVLNKIDLMVDDSHDRLEQTKDVIRSLNPNAKIICSEYSNINLKEILNTGIFDMIEASTSPGWIQELRTIRESGDDPHNSHGGEADEYGVRSFVYRARVPFHRGRFTAWIDSFLHFTNEWAHLPKEQRVDTHNDPKHRYMMKKYGNILRAKGFCWLSETDSFVIGFAQSGRIGSLRPTMPWYAVIPKEYWGVEEGSEDYVLLRSKFAEPHGK